MLLFLMQLATIYIIFREIDRGVERSMRVARRKLAQEMESTPQPPTPEQVFTTPSENLAPLQPGQSHKDQLRQIARMRGLRT